MKRFGLIAGLLAGFTCNSLNLEDYLTSPSEDTVVGANDDPLIRRELDRRDRFEKQYRKSFLGILALADEMGLAKARKKIARLAAWVTRERARWQAFDKAHPTIYATVAARKRAYDRLDPNTWTWPPSAC